MTVRTRILLLVAFALRSVCTGQEFKLSPVSGRAAMVSGGEILVRLSAPNDLKWSAHFNGMDVTPSFRAAEGSGDLLALLSGFKDGKNNLEISANGTVKAKLDIVNHPLQGPVFSGPHQKPFICQTELNGLGPALDDDCNAKTVVQYYYKSTKPAHDDPPDDQVRILHSIYGRIPFGPPLGFRRYASDQALPDDVAETVLEDGRTVPYIVRRELGVINRAIYEIRFLHQPGKPLPNPWSRRDGNWNGRLVYIFGGGLRAAYRQGTLFDWAADEALLSRGYATATSTFNTFYNNSNDVVSAETSSMVKEYFTKRYGEPVHTIGWGGSGGAMQLHLISQNYPGILDGIIPYISFPDVTTYLRSFSGDCSLLTRAFNRSKRPFAEAQRTAISGYATWRSCRYGATEPAWGIIPQHCDRVIPKNLIYDPVERPNGVRCGVFDNEVNVLGRDPKTGFARRLLDNVGVQYGLVAFNIGTIDAEQFVELNQNIGGFDVNGNMVAERTLDDVTAVRDAYRNGLVLTGAGGLPATPIIDFRSYSDDSAGAHDSFESFVTRARLIAANGKAGNQVIKILPRGSTYDDEIYGDPNPDTSFSARNERELVRQMESWLDRIAADHQPGSPAEKVTRNRPADVSDTCWTTDGQKIMGAGVYDVGGACSSLYPRYAGPRIAAGGPATDDVLKCELKPIDPADYPHPLRDDQLARLKAVFPTGVCDYSRPGVGQEITKTTWHSY
jgi:hypothetical protein